MSETLGQFLATLAQKYADREAVVLDEQRWTYGRLWSESTRVARACLKVGIGRGTRLGLLMPNRPEWLSTAFGVWRAGGTVVALNTFYHAREMLHAMRLAEVTHVIGVGRFLKRDYVALLGEIRGQLPKLRTLVMYDAPLLPIDALSWDAWLKNLAPEEDLAKAEAAVTPDQDAAVFFTSGSTAESKGVLHSHAALTHQAHAISLILGLTPDDRAWGHLPLFFSGGFILVAASCLAQGGSVVLQNDAKPESAYALLQKERCTIMAGWHQAGPLLALPGFDRSKIFLQKGSAGNVPEAMALLGEDHLAVGVYGMSETATVVTGNSADEPAELRRGSHGRPLPGVTLRIVDPESGRPHAAGEPGEILIRSPGLMKHYLGMRREECFDDEGFFRTGDEGILGVDGRLTYRGRLKDVIKTAGVNVASAEVEQVLATHPALLAVHVIGVPHPTRGENVAAFVVPRDGAVVDAEALAAWAKQHMASYKIPRHLFVVGADDIPRTGSGKIAKGQLREQAIRRLGQETAA